MTNKVTVSLPVNVSAQTRHFFEPFLTYNMSPQQVKTFSNVFVTYSGLCLDENGLIPASHHDHPHQMDEYRNEAALYYYDVEDHPGKLVTLDADHTYLLIHHPWFNYYHWLCECIFRAWMVRDRKDDFILLLPDHYAAVDFIMAPLEPFAFKNIYFIPNGKSLLVKNICIPQIKQKVDSYDYTMLREVRFFLLDYLHAEKNIKIDLGDRIYISRKKALRKKVINEELIEPVLIKHGFTIINNEDYTFWEQVAIYSNAKYLVSIHGSGLTNMLFMRDDSSILEFHKKQTNKKDWHSKAFWYLAEGLGFKYFEQVCEPTNVEDDYFNANFIVDAAVLDENLARMLS